MGHQIDKNLSIDDYIFIIMLPMPYTIRARLLAAATIKFLGCLVRLQFESDYNLSEATIIFI